MKLDLEASSQIAKGLRSEVTDLTRKNEELASEIFDLKVKVAGKTKPLRVPAGSIVATLTPSKASGARPRSSTTSANTRSNNLNGSARVIHIDSDDSTCLCLKRKRSSRDDDTLDPTDNSSVFGPLVAPQRRLVLRPINSREAHVRFIGHLHIYTHTPSLLLIGELHGCRKKSMMAMVVAAKSIARMSKKTGHMLLLPHSKRDDEQSRIHGSTGSPGRHIHAPHQIYSFATSRIVSSIGLNGRQPVSAWARHRPKYVFKYMLISSKAHVGGSR